MLEEALLLSFQITEIEYSPNFKSIGIAPKCENKCFCESQSDCFNGGSQ